LIALCPNPYRDTDLYFTKQAMSLLSEAGFESVVCPVFLEGETLSEYAGLPLEDIRIVAGVCTLAVVIGGDGTILAVARKVHGIELPLLGVNLGTKGFMTALEQDQLPLIVQAARGEMHISRRMMLDVTLSRGGKIVYSDCALNDAVIHGYGECVQITAWCNGERMTGFNGDGVVLSTPTGSTGYSMSAGGPIVEPNASSILLSPICAHAMGARPFVLGPTREISVRAEMQQGRKAYLSVDGNSVFDLASGDIMTVRRSENCTLMADLGLRSFYETAFKKLN